MSRYEIDTHHPHQSCVVGWDPSMGTFFAQVFDDTHPGLTDEFPEVWIGSTFHEIETVTELAQRLAPWAAVHPDLAAQLEADQHAEPPGQRPPELEDLIRRVTALPTPHRASTEPDLPEPA